MVAFADRIRNSYKVKAALVVLDEKIRVPLIAVYRNAALRGTLRKHSTIKIHFGCGDVADKRFLNVDARAFPHVHYITKSPFMPALPVNSAEMIYACHVFEHIPFGKQMRVLQRWNQMLTVGGQLVLSVPDFEKVKNLYSTGERDIIWAQYVLMGGQEYRGNFHFALFTHDHLISLLEKAGFVNIRSWSAMEEDNWPRDWSWDQNVSLNLKADKIGGEVKMRS